MVQNHREFGILYISICLLTAILHLIGLVLLCKIPSRIANQRLITTHLVISELFFCTTEAVLYFFKMFDVEWKNWDETQIESLWLYITHFGSTTLFVTANKLFMFHIILDRFFDIALHLKYPLYFQRKKVVRIILCWWISCSCYCMVMVVLVMHPSILDFPAAWTIHNFVSMIIDSSIALAAVGTYLYFYRKVKAMTKQDKARINIDLSKQSFAFGRKFLIPFLMIFSYLVFNISATIIYQVRMIDRSMSSSLNHLCLQTARILAVFGFLSDAVLYVFMQRNIRSVISFKIASLKTTENALALIFQN